jgi:hypothetical protein
VAHAIILAMLQWLFRHRPLGGLIGLAARNSVALLIGAIPFGSRSRTLA